jgi:hypothetical protein
VGAASTKCIFQATVRREFVKVSLEDGYTGIQLEAPFSQDVNLDEIAHQQITYNW